MDCFALSGGAKALQNNPEWIQSAQSTLRLCKYIGFSELLPYSLCMKLSKFQLEDKSKTQRESPRSALVQSFLEIKKAWSWMHLSTWGLRLPYTNKRKQLTPQNGRLPTGRFIKYACTKTMRQACTGRRRERPSYSLCMKVSKFQVENKRKLYLPWNIDFWNVKRWQKGSSLAFFYSAFCILHHDRHRQRISACKPSSTRKADFLLYPQ